MYTLVQDDSGHWYVVADDRKGEFEDWLEACYAGENDCDEPDYVIRVNVHGLGFHGPVTEFGREITKGEG